ncbi:DNA alkylation repair protein [bacterium]|nr:DNA alkylation repair protein [bacterium]NBX49245.1 DNA alkylation repair protein [bacterium]
MTLQERQNEFRKLGNKDRANINARFFKTKKGEYGEGDKFLGITVPATRLFAKQCEKLSLNEIEILLASPWHEERLLAVILLVNRYKKRDEKEREKIYTLYLKQSGKGINNWDLVDTSAAYVVGMHLEKRDRKDLYSLAASKNLWKKRVAIIATFYFIRQNDCKDTLQICEIFLTETHDLMHKACGWMLREVGKKDEDILRSFLKKHVDRMPRTMLRYAIERLSLEERTHWMKRP